jgi:hypothetical protein
MMFWVIQMVCLSLIMIGLIHHLVLFFKDTLTVPKIKDLVVSPRHQYENMYKIISSSQSPASASQSPASASLGSAPSASLGSASASLGSASASLGSASASLGQESIENMKFELRKMLKKNQTGNQPVNQNFFTSSFEQKESGGYTPFL